MRLRSLKDLVVISEKLSGCEKIIVLGSSSLLGHFPELGEASGPLVTSFDADLLLSPINEPLARSLGKQIGENTAFHQQQGYHADIVHPDITKTLPPGWETRLAGLEGFVNVFCLDPHDLAAVKITVGREKDLSLVRALLRLGKIDPATLRDRFQTMPLGERELFKAGRNLTAVLEEAGNA
jgi:hypothetical protein